MAIVQGIILLVWFFVALYGSMNAEDRGGKSAGVKFFLKWTGLCALVFLGTVLIQP